MVCQFKRVVCGELVNGMFKRVVCHEIVNGMSVQANGVSRTS